MKKYFLLSLFVSACASGQKFPVTDHCDGERFFHEGTTTDKSLWIIAKWMFTRPDTGIPDWIENTSKPELPKELPSGKTALTFVNHATFLAQTKNFNFLTDPVWSKRVSPVSFAGPKRVRNPGIAMEELPQIHFVVISHNHYDHMDVDAIENLHKKFKPVFITGLGNTKYLDHIKDIKIIELDWWQSTEVQSASATAKITMIPAKHWSARSLTDRRKSLWGGYVIESDQQKIYFSGDSGYEQKFFQELRTRFNAIDVALLPLGAYEPRWFMKTHHMNPEEAVQVHLDINAKHSIGMHFGTFHLSDEMWGQPEKDLSEAKKKLSVENFTTLDVGQTKVF